MSNQLIHEKIKERMRNSFTARYLKLLVTERSEKFVCPICNYEGPFLSLAAPTGRRKHAQCPYCGSLERHRLQYLVLDTVQKKCDISKMRILHCAPEKFFKKYFRNFTSQYETADLFMSKVDHKVDLTSLPFTDSSYDLVFASHVLEHIKEDKKAISEISRILSPGGIAILPIPIVSDFTVEYPKASAYEAFHVRAPGLDYFDRYHKCFSQIIIRKSSDFEEKYQTFVFEDRSTIDKNIMPFRLPTAGSRHEDYVPICIK